MFGVEVQGSKGVGLGVQGFEALVFLRCCFRNCSAGPIVEEVRVHRRSMQNHN